MVVEGTGSKVKSDEVENFDDIETVEVVVEKKAEIKKGNRSPSNSDLYR
jgi:hypothetical protein